MKEYVPVSCSDYDYLEIACMDGYEVELQLSNDCVRGVAGQLVIRDHQEYLLLTRPDAKDHAIRIDRIKHMRVITRPARFTEFQFSGN